MIYETIISINYKEGAVLCGKNFKDTEIEKARKFAGRIILIMPPLKCIESMKARRNTREIDG